jgi:hypothetical protein
MKKSLMVEKQSGEKEAFSPEKLQQSLSRSGASQQLIARLKRPCGLICMKALTPLRYTGGHFNFSGN